MRNATCCSRWCVVVRRFANPHEAKTVDRFAEEVVAERVKRAVEKA